MSALGQKPTYAVQNGMSALPPKATSNATYEMSAKGHKRTSEQAQCATYSITSSAREIIVGGTDKPIAFAAFKLTTSSNFVGSCTGSSEGLAPFRMRSTYDDARPNRSGVLLPKDIRPTLSAKYRSLYTAGRRYFRARRSIRSRFPSVTAWGATIKPPLGSAAKAVTPRSSRRHCLPVAE